MGASSSKRKQFDLKPLSTPCTVSEEVEDGMRSFHRDCESQKMWNNVKPSLKRLLASDKLPPVYQAVYNDPDNIDDLLTHVHEVERLLFVEVEYVNAYSATWVCYDRALATAEAMWELFRRSHLPGIGKLVSGDALALLHKLYARGNVSSARTQRYEEDNDDDIIVQGLAETDVNE
ncbi:hypothetical protein BaRGS_00007103 [Batillaria attramentaria]|uniref:Uncharacterized protein n=1 Tax=Batillaria attramentaria TaxID=370345 RepID=A0ABD0LRL7_9CAEN